MAKEKGSFKYFKIGTTASMFFDPMSKLKVVEKMPGKAPAAKCTQKNKKLVSALGHGHIIEIEKDEYDEMVANYGSKTPTKETTKVTKVEEETDEEVDFSTMTKSELDEYAEKQELFDNEEDLEEFKGLSKNKKIERLEELTS